MKYLKQIAYILLIIGGLNWGIYGVSSGYDLVGIVLGGVPMLANIVYVLVGLSAIYVLLNRYVLCGCNHSCSDSCCESEKTEPKISN